MGPLFKFIHGWAGPLSLTGVPHFSNPEINRISYNLLTLPIPVPCSLKIFNHIIPQQLHPLLLCSLVWWPWPYVSEIGLQIHYPLCFEPEWPCVVFSVHRLEWEFNAPILVIDQVTGWIPVRFGICVKSLKDQVHRLIHFRHGVAPGGNHSMGFLENPLHLLVEFRKVKPVHCLGNGD